MKQLVTGILLAGLAMFAQAAPVTASVTSGFALQAYSGTVPVNAGRLDTDRVLWTVQEQAHDGLQSWYLFYDPLNPGRVRAVVDFGAPIMAVYSTSAQLAATQASWSVDIDGDGLLNDYATRNLMGLEADDVIQWTVGDTRLTLDWRADDPGDHVRVLVSLPQAQAVPEPTSVALAMLALGLTTVIRRRRR